jgi:2,4-dienoyl-CoA reductase-like NADH-dependent reductase (Old Yellow Enzyme family)/thioredoxin reductase
MNFIKKLIGRRQFLIAAGITSTSALACKNLGGFIDPVLLTGNAMASEGSVTADKKGNYSYNNKYSHLLSPLKIGNVILKNRMIHSRSLPHFLQGPELFPSDAVISHYSGVARDGAAIVTVKGGRTPRDRKAMHGDSAHMTMWDVEDPGVQNCYSQLADAIHFYDSKASVGLNIIEPSGYQISDLTMPNPLITGMYMISAGKEIPVDLMKKLIDDTAAQAKFYQALGFDMVNIYMSYRSSIFATSLSPAINKRTDEYGGSLENRARFPLELFQAIKKACGQNFLIEAQISGEEEPGGYTTADVVKFAKLWEGSVDILQLRGWDGMAAHPTGFNSEKNKHATLPYAQAIKESGVKVVVAPIGGFRDLDMNEEYIATGKADMIAMARSYICEPEYAKKAYEGRGDDVTPCIMCNKCHGLSMSGMWYSVCSVNPKLGIAHKVNRMIDAAEGSKKVAVIGGGPAGMKAAITAAERGHKVTLYEKSSSLGGLLKHSDFSPYKWPIKDFKDFLAHQVKKAGVEVLLNIEATPEMIKIKKYQAVLVAVGAEPIISRIPGADGKNVWNVVNVYDNEKSLGKNVVFVGGGEYGVETAMFLAKAGHNVTALTSEKELLANDRVHYPEIVIDTYKHLVNFTPVTEVITTRISEGKVTYVDARGSEKSLQADSVVIYSGLKPKQDEALKFYGSAERFFVVGECSGVGTGIQKTIRSAFATASQV